MQPDKHAANAAVAIWLRDVANARIHATTGEVPTERLIVEQTKLQDLPTSYQGRTVRSLTTSPPTTKVIGYQHPLSIYDALLDPIALEVAA